MTRRLWARLAVGALVGACESAPEPSPPSVTPMVAAAANEPAPAPAPASTSPASSPPEPRPARADLDVDRDGLPLETDQCPELPELYNDVDDADGCPDAGPFGLQLDPSLDAEDLADPQAPIELHHDRFAFQFDSERLVPESIPLAHALATIVQRNEHLGVLHVEVHTDSVGAADYNLELTKARAAYLRTSLLDEGVPAERVVAEGFGETRPISHCPDGTRRCNRRVDLWFQRPPPPTE